MRLFLFLSLVAFFAVQGSIDYDDDGKRRQGVHVGGAAGTAFDQANSGRRKWTRSADVGAGGAALGAQGSWRT
jgi:hypothetical protein